MYDAKGRRSNRVHPIAVKVENGELVEIPETFTKTTAERAAQTRR